MPGAGTSVAVIVGVSLLVMKVAVRKDPTKVSPVQQVSPVSGVVARVEIATAGTAD